jgi:hypothetical protein
METVLAERIGVEDETRLLQEARQRLKSNFLLIKEADELHPERFCNTCSKIYNGKFRYRILQP